MFLGKFGQIQRVDFWVLVWLVKSVLKWLLEPLCTLVWLYVISLKFEWFWYVFGWRMFMELLWVFMDVLHCSWYVLAKNKRFGVLIQSFDLFHKVFVLKYFLCLNILDIYFEKYKEILVGRCVMIYSISHTPLTKLWNFFIYFASMAGHPTQLGSLWGFYAIT